MSKVSVIERQHCGYAYITVSENRMEHGIH